MGESFIFEFSFVGFCIVCFPQLLEPLLWISIEALDATLE
jgi:hypothetical protein